LTKQGFLAAIRYRRTLPVWRPWKIAIAAAVAAALGAAMLVLAAKAGWIDAGTEVRLPLSLLDGAVGALAMWFVGKRIAGPAAGFGCAVLWAACGVRLDYWANAGLAPTPTALLPVVVALALGLRENGVLKKEWMGVALAAVIVPMSTHWPLLALTTTLAAAFTFWSIGRTSEAGWSLFALVASGLYIWLAASGPVARELAAQAALYDPGRILVACAGGCDGGLPWEFFYPTALGSAFSGPIASLLAITSHWGDYQLYSIAPGLTECSLAIVGAIVLKRAGRTRLLGVWLTAIGLGIVLALPSHYLGLTLPTLTRAILAFAPTFEFGAQLALLSGFFVALLGGAGFAALVDQRRGILVVPSVAALGLLLLDLLFVPVPSHPAIALARMRNVIPASAEQPKLAFYPFVTQGYGPEYTSLVRAAHRAHVQLINENEGDDSAVADLSAPGTLQRLRSIGTQYIVVSLEDYSRRRDILQKARVVLPLDQYEDSSAWLTPEPSDLLGMRPVNTQADGTMLFAL
jgi:hypothetical protein